MAAWIFLYNPEQLDIVRAVEERDKMPFDVKIPKHREEIKQGDLAYIWVSGTKSGKAGIIAAGEIACKPEERISDTPDPYLITKGPLLNDDEPEPYWVVDVKIERKLTNTRVLREVLFHDQRTRRLGYILNVTFRLKEEEVKVIESIIAGTYEQIPVPKKQTSASMDKAEEYVSLLESRKNIIFTGAPGTGKTYLAQQLAKMIRFKKDGEYPLFNEEKVGAEPRLGFAQFHPSYDYTDFVEGLRPDEQGKTGFKRMDGVFKSFCKKALNDKDQKYVFIIDEINRGEISKIFGELFFSIDPDYRGIKGTVQTQYQNMITDKTDPFYDGFFVPENVYLIGTMNDIDRSVESFDFAMRRRFVWVEITAKESAENMGLDSKQEAMMERLNDAICSEDVKIEGLSSSYHIGAFYFLKEAGIDKRWEHWLNPLLKEYLRGRPDAEKEMERLKDAYYGNKKMSDNPE